MLYDCGNNVATVVDYIRKLRTLPYELVVPVYPEQGDMLCIQGKEPGDVWHGKLVSINRERNEVDVYFYVEKQHETVRLLEDWQETQFILILSLLLQLVDGLVQIAGKKYLISSFILKQWYYILL